MGAWTQPCNETMEVQRNSNAPRTDGVPFLRKIRTYQMSWWYTVDPSDTIQWHHWQNYEYCIVPGNSLANCQLSAKWSLTEVECYRKTTTIHTVYQAMVKADSEQIPWLFSYNVTWQRTQRWLWFSSSNPTSVQHRRLGLTQYINQHVCVRDVCVYVCAHIIMYYKSLIYNRANILWMDRNPMHLMYIINWIFKGKTWGKI